MTDGCKRVETTAEVWGAISVAHFNDLGVFSTFTDSYGYYGRAKAYTSWGFKNSDYPLIEMETTWDRGDDEGERLNERTRYWLLSPIREEAEVA